MLTQVLQLFSLRLAEERRTEHKISSLAQQYNFILVYAFLQFSGAEFLRISLGKEK